MKSHLSLGVFKILFGAFNIFIIIYLELTICWVSWMLILISFIKFGEFSAITPSNILLVCLMVSHGFLSSIHFSSVIFSSESVTLMVYFKVYSFLFCLIKYLLILLNFFHFSNYTFHFIIFFRLSLYCLFHIVHVSFSWLCPCPLFIWVFWDSYFKVFV